MLSVRLFPLLLAALAWVGLFTTASYGQEPSLLAQTSDLSAGSTRSLPLTRHSLSDHDQLLLHWQGKATSTQAHLQINLITADGRWFRYQKPLLLPPRQSAGQLSLSLDPGHWSGNDGPFDAWARGTVHQLQLHVHGLDLKTFAMYAKAGDRHQPRTWWLHNHDPRVRPQGPWQVWRFQLHGPDIPGQAWVEVHTSKQQRIPAFRRRMSVNNERWQPRGPALWEVRLRQDELVGETVSVYIRDRHRVLWRATATWHIGDHPAITQPPGNSAWDLFESAAWEGLHMVYQGDQARASRQALPAALAPWLHWRADWRGFLGPRHSNQRLALDLDRRLLRQPPSDIDLLPDWLFGEHHDFRFALSPWHSDHGGPWQHPQDALMPTATRHDLLAHAREVIARCRGVPTLQRWRVSMAIADDGSTAMLAASRDLFEEFHYLVTHFDGRPLHLRHPAAMTSSDHPRALAKASQLDQRANHLLQQAGKLNLAQDNQPRIELPVDESYWEVEQQQIFARNRGPSGASLYAWMRDDQHQYYQQFLGYISPSQRWQRLVIDWSAQAAWRSAQPDQPWRPAAKRRVRSLGFLATTEKLAGQSVVELRNLQTVMWPPLAPPTITLDWRQPPKAAIPRYAPMELQFDLEPAVDNPYDPAQADVVMEMRDPNGGQHEFPAFWLEPQAIELRNQREAVEPAGPGRWAWRYSFQHSGEWQIRLKARLRWHDQHLEHTSPWHQVEVGAEEPHTLLPVSASDDRRYWQTADGSWFYPMGITIRSPGDRRQNVLLQQEQSPHRSEHFSDLGTHAYDRWFTKLSAAGGNFVRMWMSPWWGALEWNRDWNGYGGLGRYHQGNAARVDRVLDQAAEHGIYLQLELLNHGMVSENVDEQFHPDPRRNELGSPYSVHNDGPLESAAEYFNSEVAWDYHQQRLRYTMARWGYATHLMAWVLSSELEFTGAYYQEAYSQRGPEHSPTTEAWIKRNLQWFSKFDPQTRPVSVHFSHPWRGERLWRSLSGLGFSYSNAYTGYQQVQRQLGHPRSGLGGALLIYLRRHFPSWELGRPTMIGEWGGHWQERDAHRLAAEWRTGLWMQAVLPYAGNTGFWWWLWLDAADAYDRIAAVRQFLADEDPRNKDLRPVIPQLERGEVRAHALGSQNNHSIRFYAYLSGLDREPINIDPEAAAGTVHFTVQQAGETWNWRRYRGSDGQRVAQGTIQSDSEGKLHLDLGILQPDAAFKLDRQTEE